MYVVKLEYLDATYFAVNVGQFINALGYVLVRGRSPLLAYFQPKDDAWPKDSERSAQDGVKMKPKKLRFNPRVIALWDFWLLVFSMVMGAILALWYMIYTSSQLAEIFRCGEPCAAYNFYTQREIQDPAYVNDYDMRKLWNLLIALDMATYISLAQMFVSVSASIA